MTPEKPMSNEEVIEVLKGIVFGGFDRTTREERQALDLAIKALEEKTKALDFSEFVGKMLFDDWEQDCNGVFPELACRRLVELGIVELKDGIYSLKRGEGK